MKWLGIDFETTGLDAQKCFITEVGAVLWDAEEKKPLMMYNDLVKIPQDAEYPEFIAKMTGITREMMETYGVPETHAFANITRMIRKADYVMAHNAQFDKSFYEAACKRMDDMPYEDKPWICSKEDVPYPEGTTSRKLVHLAAEHSFVNPFAHRALFDVLTMFTVVSQYDPQTVIEWKKSPTKTVRAMVTIADKDKAKARGYRWQPAQKIWTKQLKEFQVEQEMKEADFKVVEMR